jgi:orotidine-5'-phosphate decarboxylase
VIPRPANPLVVALDVSDPDRVESLAAALAPHVAMLKVGLELSWALGPSAIELVARHAPVFVDCKLHDIPTTVERAAANVARLGVAVLNVHALGGEAMMRAALEGARRGSEEGGVPMPLVIGVTVLSSWSGEELASPASLAFEAKASGLDGVVVSGDDVRVVREVLGEEACLVVPGIRPPGSNGNDQVRVLTPAAAIANGADYLVVGRPITSSPDPAGVARGILLEVG